MPGRTMFYTGLIRFPRETWPPPPYRGAGWVARFAKPLPEKCHLVGGREVVISARSQKAAQSALNLIVSSLYLGAGGPPLLSVPFLVHRKGEPLIDLDSLCRRRQEMSAASIPLGCYIAARASRHRRITYAIAKYRFSISTYSTESVDLEPWSAPHLKVSTFVDDHIMFAYAILAAYSAIEDVGAELRASAMKPSRIGDAWNPVVREELEARLRSLGVNVDEPILWTLRGPKRRTESRREVPIITRMHWASGPVRDADVAIIDAIAYADWLRDKATAHAAGRLTEVLSPYDVANVQHLARRVILERLGVWGHMKKKWRAGARVVRAPQKRAVPTG